MQRASTILNTTLTKKSNGKTFRSREELRKRIEEEDRKLVAKIRKENLEQRKKNIDKLFSQQSLMNDKLQRATFENYQPTNQQLSKAKATSKRYAANFSLDNPVSLLMIGNYGTGKSHLAASITKELMKKSFTCIFISIPKFLTKLKSTYNNKNTILTEDKIIEMLTDVHCLVLDDIGAEQAQTKNDDLNNQTWAASKLFEVIDNRIGKHTIFTTNFEINELQQRLGGRNFSRMMEDVHQVKMYGDDYRLRNFNE